MVKQVLKDSFRIRVLVVNVTSFRCLDVVKKICESADEYSGDQELKKFNLDQPAH